eukprot:Amastigsp_a845766_106.p2 type:complete len:284 gc:universal Amastigsp_a845766_106:1071-220(-)
MPKDVVDENALAESLMNVARGHLLVGAVLQMDSPSLAVERVRELCAGGVCVHGQDPTAALVKVERDQVEHERRLRSHCRHVEGENQSLLESDRGVDHATGVVGEERALKPQELLRFFVCGKQQLFCRARSRALESIEMRGDGPHRVFGGTEVHHHQLALAAPAAECARDVKCGRCVPQQRFARREVHLNVEQRQLFRRRSGRRRILDGRAETRRIFGYNVVEHRHELSIPLQSMESRNKGRASEGSIASQQRDLGVEKFGGSRLLRQARRPRRTNLSHSANVA